MENKEIQETKDNDMNSYDEEHLNQYEDIEENEEDFQKYEKKKMTMGELKEGFSVLKKQRKPFILFIIMVSSFLAVTILLLFGIMSRIVQYVIIALVLIFTLYMFIMQHKDDEDKLD